jgi:hypothetical protein
MADHYDSELRARFGTMFFADPVAAFTHVAHAARPGARLVMLVWQGEARNEWATAIRQVLPGAAGPSRASGLDPFSMADPDEVRSILGMAGFVDVGIADVQEPVYYGPDAAAACELVRDMRQPRNLLARLDAASAQRTDPVARDARRTRNGQRRAVRLACLAGHGPPRAGVAGPDRAKGTLGVIASCVGAMTGCSFSSPSRVRGTLASERVRLVVAWQR